jgi:hypothetical protein
MKTHSFEIMRTQRAHEISYFSITWIEPCPTSPVQQHFSSHQGCAGEGANLETKCPETARLEGATSIFRSFSNTTWPAALPTVSNPAAAGKQPGNSELRPVIGGA